MPFFSPSSCCHWNDAWLRRKWTWQVQEWTSRIPSIQVAAGESNKGRAGDSCLLQRRQKSCDDKRCVQAKQRQNDSRSEKIRMEKAGSKKLLCILMYSFASREIFIIYQLSSQQCSRQERGRLLCSKAKPVQETFDRRRL